ncbi:transposase [Pseudomonas sp. RT4P38]
MGAYKAADGSTQLVKFENDLWVVEGVESGTRKLHLRSLRNDKLCLAGADKVEPVNHEILNNAAAAHVADKTAKRALIMVEGYTPEQMEKARHRFEMIEKEMRGELTVDDAAEICKLSRPRYYEVRRLFNQELGPISLLGKKPGRKVGTKVISPELEQIIADQVWLYRGHGASYRTVWKGVQAECHERGIEEVPSYETVCDRMNNLPEHGKACQKHNKNFADDNFTLRDGFRGFSRALEQVQMDHTVADVFLASSHDRKHPVGRPWITLAICAKTKVILGFYISLRYPSLCSVAHTLKHSVMSKDAFMKRLGLQDHGYEFHGVFDELLTDNAREFRSGNLKSACSMEGIKLRHRSQKQDGGICERVLGTLNIGHVQMLPGGTASRSRKDRDYNPEVHKVMTLDEFIEYFTLSVCEYHDTAAADGKTPRDRWAEVMTGENGKPLFPRQVRDVKNFVIEVLPEKYPKVTRTGLQVNGFRYSNNVIRNMVGKKVRVKYDPVNLTQILAKIEGEWIEIPSCEKTTVTLTARAIMLKYLKKAGKLGERAVKAFLARKAILLNAIALDVPAMRRQMEIIDGDKHDPLLRHHVLAVKKLKLQQRNFSTDVEPFEGE